MLSGEKWPSGRASEGQIHLVEMLSYVRLEITTYLLWDNITFPVIDNDTFK